MLVAQLLVSRIAAWRILVNKQPGLVGTGRLSVMWDVAVMGERSLLTKSQNSIATADGACIDAALDYGPVAFFHEIGL